MSVQEFRRGWRVVLGAALGAGSGLALQPYVISLFVKPLQAEFGWSRGQIATASSAGLAGVVIGPLLGWLMDRIGVRPVILAATVGAALGYAALANQSGDIRAYYLLSVLLVVIGSGTGPIGYTRAVLGWFEERRGLALGLTLVGVSVIGLVAAPALSMIIGRYGAAGGYYALGLLSVGVGLPSAWLLVRERDRTGPRQAVAKPPGLSLATVLRARGIYVLALSIFLATAGIVCVIAQLQPMLTDAGMSRPTAALMLSGLALSVIVGRLAMGWSFDRFWPPAAAAAALLLPAAGALILMQAGAHPPLVLLGVFLIGFAQGAETDIAAYFIGRYFGLRAYSRLYAVIGIAFATGTMTGAIGSGRLYDHFHDYRVALMLAAAAFVLSAATILVMGRTPAPDPSPVTEQS